MFSNRFFLGKLGGSLALVALMGVYAAHRGNSINPRLFRCVAEPERWKDTTLWLPSAWILSVRERDFEIESGDARIRVDGRAPGNVGDQISLVGVFRADGPRLELERGRVLGPAFRLRWLMEAVSIAVLLGVLANFARHFLVRPKHLQLHRSDP